MRTISAFQFRSYVEYLNAARAQRGSKISLQLWAKRLGYRSPRSVAMVFNGQRLPSSEMVERLSKELKHTQSERRYFQLLILMERRKQKGKDVSEIVQELHKCNPSQKPVEKDIDLVTFSYLSDWYYFVLNQLVETPSFKEDYTEIRRRLRNKLTISEIRLALKTMIKLGVIKHLHSGRLTSNKPKSELLMDKPVPALNKFLTQMAHRGIEAVEEQPIEERAFDSTTLRIDMNEFEEVKNTIQTFRRDFTKRFHRARANEVYQLNIQCFAHTKAKKESPNVH